MMTNDHQTPADRRITGQMGQTDKLVKRLRAGLQPYETIALGGVKHDPRCLEAADRIEALEADKEAAVAAEREACAELVAEYENHRTWPDWVSLYSAIRARGNADALAARDARVRAEALRGIKEKAIEIMALEEDETEENLKGYARGSYFAAKCILALIPSSVSCANYADQEGDE